MPSSLPSSYVQAGAKAPPQAYSPQDEERHEKKQSGGGRGSTALLLAIIALGISVFSLYLTLTADKQLTEAQKTEIAGIASDLKALQNKELTLNAPVSTRLKINQSYPVRDLFPATFDMPLEFKIPINTELVGIGSTGQPVRFRVEEEVPVKTTIKISSAKAFGNSSIRIEKEIPVNVELYSNVKIRSAFRTELTSIEDRLERISGTQSGG